jgi:hypothetical protein
MSHEERIAQLEAALALEQAKVRELTATLEHVAKNATEADAARARTLEEEARSKALRRDRNRRYRDTRKTAIETPEDAEKTSSETSHPPPPLPPLDGPPSFPKPQSSPPLSPPTPPPPSLSPLDSLADTNSTPAPTPADTDTPKPEALKELWNRIAHPKGLQRWSAMGKQRRETAKLRLRAEPRLEAWEAFLKAKLAEPFFLGENDRRWKADVDWLLRTERPAQVTDFADSPPLPLSSPAPVVPIRRLVEM